MLIRCFVVAFVVSQGLAFGQTSAPTPVRQKILNPWATVAQPSVPADPSEIALNAEPVQGVEQRAAAIKLLSNAQFLSNVRRGPYDLKTQFTSSEGTWQIEDSSPGRNIYRWTVQGPSYSAVNLFLDQVLYSNQSSNIPLRVAQVHSAIFAHFPMYGPRASLRIASGDLNGVAVKCVLVSHMVEGPAASGPRRWEEYETCVDPQTGLLASYSPVPGFYVLYDYTNAHHLGNITFPGKFTITEARQTVVEAQVVSLSEAANAAGASIYTPTGLTALGVGFPLTPPSRMQSIEFPGEPINGATTGQFVVVRGLVAPDGGVTNAEVLASSNPGLNQKALDRAGQRRWMRQESDQNGATPQSSEAFFLTLFLTN